MADSTPMEVQVPETKNWVALALHLRNLPVKRDLTFTFVLTLVSVILMAAVSLGGLLWPSTLYPTEELLQMFVANDVVNLFLGVPVLLVALWLTKSEKLVGLLFWPGALLYILYNYIAYIFGIPFSVFTVSYVVLVLLSTYCTFTLLKSIDQKTIHEQLSKGVPVRIAGLVLVGFGVLFIFRAIGVIAGTIINPMLHPISEIGVSIADIVISILFIAGGGLMLRRSSLGYVSGLGLLFVASMLFIGLIMFLLLQPIFTGAPFVLVDIILIFIMGLVCFIPLGFFVRGVVAR
ncbi:MAG: hypothetical protein ACFFCF_03125 [Promethearchaeota archaeon]